MSGRYTDNPAKVNQTKFNRESSNNRDLQNSQQGYFPVGSRYPPPYYPPPYSMGMPPQLRNLDENELSPSPYLPQLGINMPSIGGINSIPPFIRPQNQQDIEQRLHPFNDPYFPMPNQMYPFHPNIPPPPKMQSGSSTLPLNGSSLGTDMLPPRDYYYQSPYSYPPPFMSPFMMQNNYGYQQYRPPTSTNMIKQEIINLEEDEVKTYKNEGPQQTIYDQQMNLIKISHPDKYQKEKKQGHKKSIKENKLDTKMQKEKDHLQIDKTQKEKMNTKEKEQAAASDRNKDREGKEVIIKDKLKQNLKSFQNNRGIDQKSLNRQLLQNVSRDQEKSDHSKSQPHQKIIQQGRQIREKRVVKPPPSKGYYQIIKNQLRTRNQLKKEKRREKERQQREKKIRIQEKLDEEKLIEREKQQLMKQKPVEIKREEKYKENQKFKQREKQIEKQWERQRGKEIQREQQQERNRQIQKQKSQEKIRQKQRERENERERQRERENEQKKREQDLIKQKQSEKEKERERIRLKQHERQREREKQRQKSKERERSRSREKLKLFLKDPTSIKSKIAELSNSKSEKQKLSDLNLYKSNEDLLAERQKQKERFKQQTILKELRNVESHGKIRTGILFQSTIPQIKKKGVNEWKCSLLNNLQSREISAITF